MTEVKTPGSAMPWVNRQKISQFRLGLRETIRVKTASAPSEAIITCLRSLRSVTEPNSGAESATPTVTAEIVIPS